MKNGIGSSRAEFDKSFWDDLNHTSPLILKDAGDNKQSKSHFEHLRATLDSPLAYFVLVPWESSGGIVIIGGGAPGIPGLSEQSGQT